MNVQTIELNGTPALVVLPIEEWRALQARLEELADIAAAGTAQHEEHFPSGFVDRLLAGEAPLRVWREYRGLSRQSLADQCGIPLERLAMIETGQIEPSVDLLAHLARLLKCDMEDLLEAEPEDEHDDGFNLRSL